MGYDFDREQSITETLEASGYRQGPGAKEERVECPFCDSPYNVTTTTEAFRWVDVEYRAPVRHCGACGESWTDYAQEDAQLEALRRAGYVVNERGDVTGRVTNPEAGAINR